MKGGAWQGYSIFLSHLEHTGTGSGCGDRSILFTPLKTERRVAEYGLRRTRADESSRARAAGRAPHYLRR